MFSPLLQNQFDDLIFSSVAEFWRIVQLPSGYFAKVGLYCGCVMMHAYDLYVYIITISCGHYSQFWLTGDINIDLCIHSIYAQQAGENWKSYKEQKLANQTNHKYLCHWNFHRRAVDLCEGRNQWVAICRLVLFIKTMTHQ